MNIYLQELKANMKSIIIWSVSIILLIAMGMVEFSSMEESGESITKMIEAMPKSLQALYGDGAFDLNTAIGYYSVLFLYLVLMATIHAVMLGSGIISKEERDNTVEFLMVKPISRYNIITAKLLTAFTNIIILNLVTLIVSIGLVGNYSKGASVNEDIFKLMIGMFLLQLLFMSIGTAIAAFRNNSKIASGISTGILLATFFLSIIDDMSKKLSFLKYITPFKYFDAKTLLVENGFNPFLVLLSLGISGLMTYFTYTWYNKRDLGH